MRRMLIAAALAAAALAALPRSSAQDAADRDEQLWSQIVRIVDQATAATEPRPEAELARRRALLEKAQLYQSLYPGGARSARVAQLELQTLFEIGCLTGGDYESLTSRCRVYQQATNAPATRAEAAYWQIICRRAARDSAGAAPTGSLLTLVDEPMRAEYRQHVRTYPDSRHAPRMNEVLFADARQRDDLDAMRAIVARQSASFPTNMVTENLAGALRLRECVGKPFPIETIGNGGDVEIQSTSHGVGLIVVWSGHGAGIATARAVEAFRGEHSGVWVFGLNVDPDRETFRRSTAQVRVAWPQHWHELGRAGPFCRHWGIRRIPTVIVVDRAGRLVGAYDRESWRPAADKALSEGAR